ncbi:MAG: hypothetical protein R2777_00350 [Chitinophagales bacterium]
MVKDEIKADKIIIATGSKPVELPFAKFDKKRIISSTEALALSEIKEICHYRRWNYWF